MFSSEYLEIISRYGWLPAIAIFLLLCVKKLFLKKPRRKVSRQSKYDSLLKHSFFVQMEYWLKVFIPSINTGDKASSMLCQDLLKSGLEIFLRHTKKIVMVCRKNDWEFAEFRDFVMDDLLSIAKECEQAFLREYVPKRITKRFLKINSDATQAIAAGISEVMQSSFYNNLPDRLNAILVVITARVATMISAFEKAFSSQEMSSFKRLGLKAKGSLL